LGFLPLLWRVSVNLALSTFAKNAAGFSPAVVNDHLDNPLD
jgi:hypothetical protein